MRHNKKANPRRQPNCRVWSPDDSSHVSTATPMATKKRQMLEAIEAGLDSAREKATGKARRGGSVRPLGGSTAQRSEK